MHVVIVTIMFAATVCCDEVKTLETLLHFCIFLLNPNIDLELDCINSTIYCAYGNTVNFSCTSQIYFRKTNMPLNQ